MMIRGSIIILGLTTISLGFVNVSNVGIIGGKDADIKDFPYQASFINQNEHVCGAVLIGDKWALTTAKCTFEIEAIYNCTVRLGSSKLYEGGQVVNISSISWHPFYQPYIQDNDLAIVEFGIPVNFSATVKPIPLFENGQSPKEGANAIISGWGATDKENGTLSTNLKMAVVPIANHCNCTFDYADNHRLITRRMVCAGSKNAKNGGACSGDEGGPLVVDGKLAGLNSYFFGCGNNSLPGVYVNIGSFRDYIKQVTGI